MSTGKTLVKARKNHTAMRVRVVNRGSHLERQYRLSFTHQEGDGCIRVRFAHHHPHGEITVTEPLGRDVFEAAVRSHVAGLTDSALILQHRLSLRSARPRRGGLW